MSSAPLRDRLQPALLDRLTDHEPGRREEAEDRRVMSKAQLREAVLRDLRWLLNATQPQPQWNDAAPELAASVLNFGLPPISGERVSGLDLTHLARTVAQALRRFEPRILPDSLEVHVVESSSAVETHNTIEIEIRGLLWAQPVPLEVLLRTELDLEAGQVQLQDTSAGILRAQE